MAYLSSPDEDDGDKMAVVLVAGTVTMVPDDAPTPPAPPSPIPGVFTFG